MANRNKRHSQGFQRKPKAGKQNKRGKEVEINVPDKMINVADVKHILAQGAENDYDWYHNIPELFNDYANIFVNRPAGMPYNPLKASATSKVSNDAYVYTAPAIMTIRVMPTIGKCTSFNDAPNQAWNQLYIMTNSKNSRNTDYDPTDMGLTVLATINAYALYEFLCRAYRSIGKYDPTNRNFPDVICRALRISPSLKYSLPDFRGVLDAFAYQLASIKLPDIFAYTKRQAWMYSHVYTDAADSKAQLYAYMPDGFYVYDETTGDDKQLTYVDFETLFGLNDKTTMITTLEQIINAVNTLMNPLLGSKDFQRINRDIAQAFSESGMVGVSPISDYEELQPEYKPEVLLQMSNSFVPFEFKNVFTNYNITIDNLNVSTGPVMKQQFDIKQSFAETAPTSSYLKPVLNFIDMPANPDNVAVATRMVLDVNPGGDGSLAIPDLTYGTEIVTEYRVWSVTSASGSNVSNVVFYSNYIAVYNGPPTESFVQNYAILSSFDWAPGFYYITQPTGSNKPMYLGNTIDLCNYIDLNHSDLANLHYAMIMSLFAPKGYKFS